MPEEKKTPEVPYKYEGAHASVKPVPLKAPKDGDGPLEAPDADAKGPLPRVIHQNERSPDPEKFTRFKVRATNYDEGGGHRAQYILTKKDDEDGARDCYLKHTRLDKFIDDFKRNIKDKEKEKEIQPVHMTVTKLPD